MTSLDYPPPPPPPPPSGEPFSAQTTPPPWHPVDDLLPPAGDAAPAHRKHSRLKRGLAGALVAVFVAGAVAGGILAFRFVRGSADSMISLVPSDAALYVNVNLDPPGGQKMALNDLLKRFPAVSSDSQRDAWINTALDGIGAQAGFNHADVRPWLGSQIAFAGQPNAFGRASFAPGASGPRPADFAILISSNDDSKAQAALDKLRSGSFATGWTWSTTSHDGVAVTKGEGTGVPVVWAIVNHTAVLGGSETFVDHVVDTAHGKQPSLDASGDYKTVLSQLPGDHFALLYVSFPELLKQLSSAAGSLPGAALPQQVLGAYHGVGAVVSASSDGLAVNAVQDYDRSKLPPEAQKLLGVPPDQNGVLALVPAQAYGFFALTGLRESVHYFTAVFGAAPSPFALGPTLDQLGITGPNGVIDHLTGDAGFEVDALPGSSVPSGAFLFATDSGPAAQRFLDNVMSYACQTARQCDASQESREPYAGTTITSVGFGNGGSQGFTPSWAVLGSWGILASTPDEVKAVIDTDMKGGGITAASNYVAVSSHTDSKNNTALYVDIQAIVAAVRRALPPDAQTFFDTFVAANLSPLRALSITSTNAPDHSASRLFLKIS